MHGVDGHSRWSSNDFTIHDPESASDAVRIAVISDKEIEIYSGKAPYFNEHVRKELEKIDKELGINIYSDGLKVFTTIDTKIQEILEEVFEENAHKIPWLPR